MSKNIDCFIPYLNPEQAQATVSSLKESKEVNHIFLLCTAESSPEEIEGCERLDIPSLYTYEAAQAIAQKAKAPYTLVYFKEQPVTFTYLALERFVNNAADAQAYLTYADHWSIEGGETKPAPCIDYQMGSLRDDFDFGSVLLYQTDQLKQFFLLTADSFITELKHAIWYAIRLEMSDHIFHIQEKIYTEQELDLRKSGEKQFDYVDPRNRQVQIEMEKACTEHLKVIGAYLEPVFKEPDLSVGDFEYEASVVIPCRNRVGTIGDAIRSALGQKTDFKYNVIVVDDNSTDGTVDVIRSFNDPRLIYIAQDKSYHAIGGNWNAALHHPSCGRFALQLDSDDMYSGPDTVSKFVAAFREQNCAMVIGSYCITDFNLNPLPPGIIDHKEWTPDNGRNNALRINGLGAPRGFWTPLARSINFPTTKYGEDYAVALRISRDYRIGRIWDVLYNCRRWDGNSDAALSVEKTNANNLYKDRIRTWEVEARIKRNNG